MEVRRTAVRVEPDFMLLLTEYVAGHGDVRKVMNSGSRLPV
jgi:hypothetical protein